VSSSQLNESENWASNTYKQELSHMGL